MDEIDPASTRWHIGKRVDLSLIAAIIAQAALILWGIFSVLGQIAANAENIAKLDERVVIVERRTDDQRETNARIDERLLALINAVTRVERLLEKERDRP